MIEVILKHEGKQEVITEKAACGYITQDLNEGNGMIAFCEGSNENFSHSMQEMAIFTTQMIRALSEDDPVKQFLLATTFLNSFKNRLDGSGCTLQSIDEFIKKGGNFNED